MVRVTDPKVRWPAGQPRHGRDDGPEMKVSGMTRLVVPSRAIRRRSVLLALVAALAVVLGGPASAVAAQSGGTQSVSGILGVVEGDPLGGGRHRIKTYVADAQGRWTPVALSQAQIEQAGGLPALRNRRVTVAGTSVGGAAAAPGLAPGEPAPLVVESLTLGSGSDGVVSPTGAAAAGTAVAVTGARPVLNIMCKFADIAAEPKDTAYFDGLIGESHPGMGHYWRENSYGAVNLTGSLSTGWLTLPSPRATYVGAEANLDLLHKDCRQRAVNAGRDPAAFAMLNLVFNGELDGAAWGSGDFKGERVTWLPPMAYASHAFVAHEMGHAFGLRHSNFDGGRPDAWWANAWDVMGNFKATNVAHQLFGNLGWHVNTYHKDVLGWMPAARKYVLPAGSTRTVRLERSAQPATEEYRMIQIAAGGGRFFTVEARQAVGYDAGRSDAVIIHEVVPTRQEPSWVVGSDGGAGAKWTVGETFADAVSGTRVRVDSATATGFVVTVTSGLKVLTVARSGMGKVTGPGIACGTGAGIDCSEAYLPGTTVTLTATAFTNTRIGEIWTFDHWEGACTGTARTCTLTMSAARSVMAVFVDLSE
jgi:hypothetical protein